MTRELLNVPPQVGFKQPYPMEMYQQGQYYAPAPIPQGNLALGDIINALRDIQMNPGNYSNEEIETAKQMSMDYLGKPLEFKSDLGRMAKNAAFELADTAAFGLIPDKWGPSKLTKGDDIAGMVGSTAAFFANPISPIATGSRLAAKLLPNVTKLGTKTVQAVEAMTGAEKAIAKGTGMLDKVLADPNTVRRIGSAIGGGFNFEDGINPMGAALGAFFPYLPNKGSVKPVPKSTTVSNQMDMATAGKVVWQQRDTPLGKMMYERYVNGKVVLPSEYQHIAKQFGVSIDDVKNTEELIRNLVKSPKWQIPEKSDMLSNLDDINSNAMKAHEKAYNLYTEEVMRPINDVAKVKALPSRTSGIEGVAPVNVLPNSGRVIPVGEAPVNPIVQMGKARLSVTPEMEKLVSQYDMLLGKSIKDMTAKEIVDSYNYLLQFLR